MLNKKQNKYKQKPNLIIVEGSRGTGKSSATHQLRQQLKYTNLCNLTGNKYPNNENKTYTMYKTWNKFLYKMRNKGINFLFDRYFFSEIALCRLKRKEYDFEKSYKKLKEYLVKKLSKHYNIYFILLYCDEDSFKIRLKRDKIENNNYDPYSVQNSIDIQEQYMRIYNDLTHYKNINSILIDNSNINIEETIDIIKNHIKYRYIIYKGSE